MNKQRTIADRKGFTLIEIVIVVFIIITLAAIAVPAFFKVRSNARVSAFASDLRTLSNASESYVMEMGEWPPDTPTGVFPVELEGYIRQNLFEAQTSIGGNWDFEEDENGVISALGVVDPTATEDVITRADTVFDDGNLNTGIFKKIAPGRYYYIIAE